MVDSTPLRGDELRARLEELVAELRARSDLQGGAIEERESITPAHVSTQPQSDRVPCAGKHPVKADHTPPRAKPYEEEAPYGTTPTTPTWPTELATLIRAVIIQPARVPEPRTRQCQGCGQPGYVQHLCPATKTAQPPMTQQPSGNAKGPTSPPTPVVARPPYTSGMTEGDPFAMPVTGMGVEVPPGGCDQLAFKQDVPATVGRVTVIPKLPASATTMSVVVGTCPGVEVEVGGMRLIKEQTGSRKREKNAEEKRWRDAERKLGRKGSEE
ncbi:UNVERIFIED_CONTAM: hypothetical protein FKN15_023733 [Acipenser sinensis]